MERIMYRARKAAEEGGKAPSVRETPESIDELRRRYEDLRDRLPADKTEVIDAGGSREEVAGLVWDAVNRHFSISSSS